MKKIFILLSALFCISILTSCSGNHVTKHSPSDQVESTRSEKVTKAKATTAKTSKPASGTMTLRPGDEITVEQITDGNLGKIATDMDVYFNGFLDKNTVQFSIPIDTKYNPYRNVSFTVVPNKIINFSSGSIEVTQKRVYRDHGEYSQTTDIPFKMKVLQLDPLSDEIKVNLSLE